MSKPHIKVSPWWILFSQAGFVGDQKWVCQSADSNITGLGKNPTEALRNFIDRSVNAKKAQPGWRDLTDHHDLEQQNRGKL